MIAVANPHQLRNSETSSQERRYISNMLALDRRGKQNLSTANDEAKSGNISVVVSGSSFCLVPSLYERVENLNWIKRKDTLHLDADPDVFEVVLKFFLFQSLPQDYDLSPRQAAELVIFCTPLTDVAPLIERTYKLLAQSPKQNRGLNSFRKQMSKFSFRRSSSAGSEQVHSPAQAVEIPPAPIPVVEKIPEYVNVDPRLDPPSVQGSTSLESDASSRMNSVHSNELASANIEVNQSSEPFAPPPQQVEGAKTSQRRISMPNIKKASFRGMLRSSSSRVPRTHAEWCKSEYVV